MHLPPTTSVLSIFIFLTSHKALFGFLPISLIFITASSFIAIATTFLAAVFNLLYSFCASSVGLFVISLYASFLFCISSSTPLFHHYTFTLYFLFFIYQHTSSQAFSTLSLKGPHKSLWLSDIMSLILHSNSCL